MPHLSSILHECSEATPRNGLVPLVSWLDVSRRLQSPLLNTRAPSPTRSAEAHRHS